MYNDNHNEQNNKNLRFTNIRQKILERVPFHNHNKGIIKKKMKLRVKDTPLKTGAYPTNTLSHLLDLALKICWAVISVHG